MARTLKDYPEIALKLQDACDRIDFIKLFGRSAAVHIEVGCGKSTFLLNEAKSHPEINFLGIEWASRYYRYSVDRIGRWGLKNVRLIRTDAAGFIADFVGDESVNCFHIYFPDPWPKKRHHKRRFICQKNLEQVLRCLKSGGVIRIATDHSEYFRQIQLLLAERSGVLQQIDFMPTTGANMGEWVGTNFERKYLKEQRPIYTIAAVKKT